MTERCRTIKTQMKDQATEFHKKYIVLDSLNAVYPKDFNEQFVTNLRAGGTSCIHVTIPDVECFSITRVVHELAGWFSRLRQLEASGIRLATTVKEIRKVKDEGAITVILGSQGAGFLGLDLSTLDFFFRLGMRTMQPTYQQRNQFGSGCSERTDDGLSNLGIDWVGEMNRLGMVISISHAGYRTSLDVIQTSKNPVIFSHSNPRSLCEHPRNITDDQIKACAEKDGVVGLSALTMFVSAGKKVAEQTVEDYVNHIDYVVQLVGADHVGIGLDCSDGDYYTPERIMEERRLLTGLTSKHVREVEDIFLRSGRDRIDSYELHTPWLKDASQVPIITEALLRRGYSEQELKKILGENFLRVFERVWGN
jgi:membrane dipeptidase